MVTLYCDLGDTRDVACGLGEPLRFEDGYADVDDEAAAERIVNTHRHVHFARNHGDATAAEDSPAEPDEDEPGGFDVEAFVDRTPIDVVIDDLESGEYDDFLDAIEEAADRVGVQDAIESRRET